MIKSDDHYKDENHVIIFCNCLTWRHKISRIRHIGRFLQEDTILLNQVKQSFIAFGGIKSIHKLVRDD